MTPKIFNLLFCFCLVHFIQAQPLPAPAPSEQKITSCLHGAILQRHLAINPNALAEIAANEAFIQDFIEQRKTSGIERDVPTYVIPVVLHVFHDGDDGKMDSDQVLSGMEVLNNDFNGLNPGWNNIDPIFDPIKASLDIQFCLATIDPDGNPTTGVLYYDDPLGMINADEANLFQYAWDNYKYLNIYIPKYVYGGPSDFTAYAYYPSTPGSNVNQGGVFYSSIRWGYGSQSELNPGQDWASVITHELGHWLNLAHTFQDGCSGSGDFVADTPPTEGGTIYLSGCNNSDFTCGVQTNGSNFMDYNHDCKKMFTQGQVDRMVAALSLPSRITLWSEENLIATGCVPEPLSVSIVEIEGLVNLYPNPASDQVTFDFEKPVQRLLVFDTMGRLVFEEKINAQSYTLAIGGWGSGLFFYQAVFDDGMVSGKFMKR